ncbi:4-hydroxythreonine-4-phosphate dehydrogenase PdxA [Pirellulaceae bacterium SH449]
MPDKPVLAITLGDPTGIGPEITIRSIACSNITESANIVVLGSPVVLRRVAQFSDLDLSIECIDDLDDAKTTSYSTKTTVRCLPTGPDEWDDLQPTVMAKGGEAAYQCLVRGTELALAKKVDAIVTCPLHKVALHLAGHDWPGHTELLAELCGVRDHAMMLYLPPQPDGRLGPLGLGVVHVTLHMALREVFAHITQENILEKIGLAHHVFDRIGQATRNPYNVRIAVAALNPHCGEQGRFGREEIDIIQPAVELAKQNGLPVVGPLAVDSLMNKAAAGEYDAVVAMYHDQGHIALKLLDMFDAVNITLGLPIVRTSVAHGTAHDIAWTNRATNSAPIQYTGMIRAVQIAASLAQGPR